MEKVNHYVDSLKSRHRIPENKVVSLSLRHEKAGWEAWKLSCSLGIITTLKSWAHSGGQDTHRGL